MSQWKRRASAWAKEAVEMSSLDHWSTETEKKVPLDSAEFARQEAVKAIERRRHFHIRAVASGVGMAILVLIWALSEYHNAGGWPTNGFSQSSGIHDVWNYWIVYPIGAWVL